MYLGLALLHGEPFSWTEWRVYADFMTGWLLMLGAYFLVIGPLRHRFPGSRPVPRKRVASFTTGMVLMFLAPVFYPVTALPEHLRGWLYLNPLTFVIEQAPG